MEGREQLSCGLAILIGADPTVGAGVARILASSSQGNLAVALLAPNPETLAAAAESLRSSTTNLVGTFPSDRSPEKLSKAFRDIKDDSSFQGLKLRLAVYHMKQSARRPFLEETHEQFTAELKEYVGGAMIFSQEVIKRLLDDHGDKSLADDNRKKGTLILTGTSGAVRTNATFASYGASRSGARSLAQALAKEYSRLGIHVVHTIVNGAVKDEEGEAQQTETCMAAEELGELGKNYWWLCQQGPKLWTHELDMRPPQEKF